MRSSRQARFNASTSSRSRPRSLKPRRYFERENRGVLKKPAVRLLIGDGRSHLRLSDRQYDVIVSEPSNPWMAGVAALFTREFFEAARARLRSGGVFCQWAHTYEIAERGSPIDRTHLRLCFP